MAAAMDLRNWLQNSTIDDLVKEASSDTVTGLQEVFKALEHAKACLIGLGVKSQ
jgi:ribosomal protein L7Ae-like RNA K-turn-binding protein